MGPVERKIGAVWEEVRFKKVNRNTQAKSAEGTISPAHAVMEDRPTARESEGRVGRWSCTLNHVLGLPVCEESIEIFIFFCHLFLCSGVCDTHDYVFGSV